jgi:hypothetical protein
MGGGIEEIRTFPARGGAQNCQELEKKGTILGTSKRDNRN